MNKPWQKQVSGNSVACTSNEFGVQDQNSPPGYNLVWPIASLYFGMYFNAENVLNLFVDLGNQRRHGLEGTCPSCLQNDARFLRSRACGWWDGKSWTFWSLWKANGALKLVSLSYWIDVLDREELSQCKKMNWICIVCLRYLFNINDKLLLALYVIWFFLIFITC